MVVVKSGWLRLLYVAIRLFSRSRFDSGFTSYIDRIEAVSVIHCTTFIGIW